MILITSFFSLEKKYFQKIKKLKEQYMLAIKDYLKLLLKKIQFLLHTLLRETTINIFMDDLRALTRFYY